MKLCPSPTKPDQDLVMTPPELADSIVSHFSPWGRILEPCRGDGAFYNALGGSGVCDWCEIREGRNFLGQYSAREFDWIITNPPWSKDLFNEFLSESMRVAKHVVFLVAMNKLMTRSRMETMDNAGFALREMFRVPRPEKWPSSGFEYAAMYFAKDWNGQCKISKLGFT